MDEVIRLFNARGIRYLVIGGQADILFLETEQDS